MTQSNTDFLAQATQQFQQAFTQSWTKALESFQGLDLGAAGAGFPAMAEKPPEIHFAPEKLQTLLL